MCSGSIIDPEAAKYASASAHRAPVPPNANTKFCMVSLLRMGTLGALNECILPAPGWSSRRGGIGEKSHHKRDHKNDEVSSRVRDKHDPLHRGQGIKVRANREGHGYQCRDHYCAYRD